MAGKQVTRSYGMRICRTPSSLGSKLASSTLAGSLTRKSRHHEAFSKNVSAKDLLDRASHQEAVARIRFCIAEALLGVITGEVGVGKTVAVRAAISQLDQAAHHIVYLANPTVGTRGLYVNIVQALGP